MIARSLLASVMAALITLSSARAEPSLLATYSTSGALDGIVGPAAPVQLYIELYATDPLYQAYDLGLGTYWEAGDVGECAFDESSPGFDGFASLATNGTEDRFIVGALLPAPDWGGGSGGPEPWLFGRSPDLVDYALMRVEMSLHELSFQESVTFPGTLKLEYDVTYRFYGTAVPEPGTQATLFAMTVWLMAIRRW